MPNGWFKEQGLFPFHEQETGKRSPLRWG
jgi:hypothetical protein